MSDFRRCGAAKKDGSPCKSRAMNDSGTCLYHSDTVDRAAAGRKGGVESQRRRSVRERLKEDVETHYEKLFSALLEAVEASATRWGDCPSCGHRVPVVFPDINARTRAVQVLVDQGYGRPAESIEHKISLPAPSARLEDMSEEQRELLREQLYARLLEPEQGKDRLRELGPGARPLPDNGPPESA